MTHNELIHNLTANFGAGATANGIEFLASLYLAIEELKKQVATIDAARKGEEVGDGN